MSRTNFSLKKLKKEESKERKNEQIFSSSFFSLSHIRPKLHLSGGLFRQADRVTHKSALFVFYG
jgi:hypothetical protein